MVSGGVRLSCFRDGMARRSTAAFLRQVEELCQGRVPLSWRGKQLGVQVPCGKRDDPKGRVGSKVVLRREGEVTVAGCATPVGGPRRPGRRCQGAWWVEGLRGIGWAVEKSKVRERQRPPREMCEDWDRTFNSRLSAALDEGVSDPDELLSVAERLGDLPYPHRAGGHVCCSRHPGQARARRALERLEDPEEAARVQVWQEWIATGQVEPWDEPDFLTREKSKDFEREVRRRKDQILESDPEVRQALELESYCTGIWKSLVEKQAPKEGSYQGELAKIKRAVRALKYSGREDDLLEEIGALRERFEVKSTSPLVGEWFRLSSAEKSQEQREYQAQRASWGGG